MSIENQIERLTAAIEANTGALIALMNNKVDYSAIANAVAPIPAEPNAAPPAAEGKSNRGRRPTRYWKLADGSAVKSSAEDAPSAGAVEINKDEYERLNHERATAAHKEQTTAQAAENPFGDDPTTKKTVTLEDVRTVALAYRDKHGQEKAKEIIKSVAGVDSLKDAPANTWVNLIATFTGRSEPEDEI